MIHRKSVKELTNILSSFKSALAEYDKDSKRDKKRDYKLLPQSELKYVLKSGIPDGEKKNLLLSQIGLLRINLFMEHYERIRTFEENNQLDEAIKIMNDYAVNVAIPFIPAKKSPSLINRFMDLIAKERLLEPFEYVQKWRTEYQSWVKSRKIPMNQSLRQEKFSQLKIVFNMLYTVSFSDNNFPPSPTIILHDPSRIKI